MFLTKNQKGNLIHWALIFAPIEVITLLFHKITCFLMIMIGIAFFIGFFLRLIGKYPGKHEPLILDISSGTIAVVGGLSYLFFTPGMLAIFFRGMLLIIILIPHLIYILKNRDVGPSRFKLNKLK